MRQKEMKALIPYSDPVTMSDVIGRAPQRIRNGLETPVTECKYLSLFSVVWNAEASVA